MRFGRNEFDLYGNYSIARMMLVLSMIFMFTASTTYAGKFNNPFKKDKKKDTTQMSFQEELAQYKEDRPESSFVNTTINEVDLLGMSVATLYDSEVEKFDKYLVTCDNSRVRMDFNNGIKECQQNGESDEASEACYSSEYEKLSPEGRKEIDAFVEANDGKLADSLKALGAVAGMSLSVYAMVEKGPTLFVELGLKSRSALKSLTNMKDQVVFLTKTKKLYSRQKATMKSFKENQGR